MKKKIALIIIIVLFILGIACLIIPNKSKDSNNTTKNEIYSEIVNNIPTKNIPDGIVPTDEEGLEIEGFEEDNPDFISGNIKNDDKFIVGAIHNSPIYYSQVDSRWKNHPYTITGNSSQTIGTSGCGPTAAAMVVSSIKGTIIPPDMGDLYVRYGFRTTNNGTYFSAFKWTAEYFDIPYTRVYNVDDMINLVIDSYYCIVSCGEGLFTYGGHFIVVYNYTDSNNNGFIDNDDILSIYDPYLYNGKFDTSSRSGKVTVDGTTVYCSIGNFKNYANSTSYHGFKHNNEIPNTPIPTPEPTQSTTKYVNAKSGLYVRTGPGTNYSIVRGLSNGTRVEVYETSSNWSRIGNNEWVCSDYLKDSNSTSNNTTTNTNWTGRVTAKSGLYVRKGPSTNYSIVSSYSYNTSVTILEQQNNWGKTNKGWICLDYISKSSNSTTTNTSSKYSLGRYKVNTKSGLHVRTGPSTNYKSKRIYSNGTIFDTYKISGNWAQTPSGWVCLDYCTLIYKY